MSIDHRSSALRNALGGFAPKLVDLTDEVLFGNVWERPRLSKRDRSLVTCAALVALGKTEQSVEGEWRPLARGLSPRVV